MSDVHELRPDFVSRFHETWDRLEEVMTEATDAYLEALNALEIIEAENAKLRKFVLTLAFCANDEADCDQCPMNGARCDVVQQCFCDGAATALRELGIEVDG